MITRFAPSRRISFAVADGTELRVTSSNGERSPRAAGAPASASVNVSEPATYTLDDDVNDDEDTAAADAYLSTPETRVTEPSVYWSICPNTAADTAPSPPTTT